MITNNYIAILKIFSLTIITLVLSCSNHEQDRKHEQLISFNSQFIMDMDEIFDRPEREYQRLTDEFNFYPETDTIKYKNDTIYISYLTYVNACAKYSGNIEMRNDTLILKAKNILEEECASGRIDRFIYKIYNPDNKKYTIVKY